MLIKSKGNPNDFSVFCSLVKARGSVVGTADSSLRLWTEIRWQRSCLLPQAQLEDTVGHSVPSEGIDLFSVSGLQRETHESGEGGRAYFQA